jgi:hypothetical protein
MGGIARKAGLTPDEFRALLQQATPAHLLDPGRPAVDPGGANPFLSEWRLAQNWRLFAHARFFVELIARGVTP